KTVTCNRVVTAFVTHPTSYNVLIYNAKISDFKFVTVVTALRIPPQTLARPFKMLIKPTYSVSLSLTLCD
ncbi:TPA: hypothetical protein ACWKP8_001529, partial [Escherichia coli]